MDDDVSNASSGPLLVEESMMSSSSSPRSDAGNDSADRNDVVKESKPSNSSVDRAVPNRAGSRLQVTSLLERLLKLYCSYMSSPLHQDRGLKFLQWTLWLVSKLFRNPSRSKHLRKLYLDVSFARYVTRLLGFPAALEAALTGSWTPSSDRYGSAMGWVGRALSWSMAGYYPTEHIAYVQWMLPSAFPPERRTAERWSYISCRFWLLYVVAEATQCVLQWRELASSAPKVNGNNDDDDDDNKLAKADREAALRKVKVLLTRDLLFLLPCINWSLPNWDTDPWLSETVINTLMWLESVVCLTLA
jgi:Peroxisomal biogenesis factor 11 (PEX11)